MSDFTVTAESVINSVIQDGQVQTTNRNLLLDYVNRTSMRMLRESQWKFLRSPVQKFITEPGAGRYWLGSDSVPSGCVNSNLLVDDVASILPESVFDLTNNSQLFQNSPSVQNQDSFLYKDGQIRTGLPASFSYDFLEPGIFKLFPLPDNQNQYYPVPAATRNSFVSGGTLGKRTYYTVASYVDSFGNEGTASTVATTIGVPAGALMTVQSPDSEVPSATQITYSGWNLYVGSSFSGPFFLQNSTPIPVGTSYQEPVTGVSYTSITPPATFPLMDSLGNIWYIGVDPSGNLTTTEANVGYVPTQLYLKDSNSIEWWVQISTVGTLVTTGSMGILQAPLYLVDSSANAWLVGVDTNGILTTTFQGPASGITIPTRSPLKSPNITPLLGYVIGFRYQQKRVTITSMDQILQIPNQYYDIVVAGVNYYANLYTSKSEDINIKAAAWKKEFLEGLAQIRRDFQINFRNTDFLSPDPQTQYNSEGATGFYVQ